MMRGRRIAAAFGALALTSAAGSAQSQDNSGTVGNPQLKNFELPGTTTVPAPPGTQAPATQPPATQAPATQPTASQPAPVLTLPPVDSAAPPAQAARDPAPAPAPQPRAPARTPQAPAAAPAPAVPAPGDLSEALPAPLAPPAATVPQPAPQALPSAPPAAEQGGAFPWQYLAAAALLALLGFAGYRKLRRPSREDAYSGEEPQPEPQPTAEPAAQPVAAPPTPPAAAPQPAPTPQPAPASESAAAAASDAGVVGIQLRPWLEIEFRPDRAAATLTDASVQFELVIRNRGNAPARNVRIESAIFNAGAQQEQEIADWYREPVRDRTPPSIAVIPPRGAVQLRSAVTMAKEQVREIEVQGRRLFIPTVAFNVIYDWGANKSGQTSMSYVVGREPETPSEKMAPFRLDLGPRLYRSVGQRQTRVAVMV